MTSKLSDFKLAGPFRADQLKSGDPYELVLAERGLGLAPAQRSAIADCNDPGQLRHWLGHAVSATSASDVLGQRPA